MHEFLNEIMSHFQLPLQDNILVFSLILFIILLAPIILKKVNIPGIIGLIIAGVVIGPYGLNIVENNEAVELFSTIGLLYIMFIAGLELDLNEFKLHKNKSIIFAALTFIIPLAIGYPVCHYLLDYGFNTSLLTASMFATHTLVAYPIVSKMGTSKNQAVVITVGGTILTDTAVLIILAVIVGNAQGNVSPSFWLRLGISVLLFTAIMFLVIPRIAKWFFEKVKSEKYSHYIFILSLVFLAAFLAEEAGIEPIIGAFFAGLALNKLIPHSSPLMDRIEFLGNALFIPFFLISVGMLINVRVILSGTSALIVAGTLVVVAVSGKWIAAWVTQLVFKLTKAQRQIIFGLSGAHAAATLAVILVGYKEGIIDDNILNGTIILILITSLLASLVTEKASKKVKKEDAEDTEGLVKSSGATKEHILMPLDNVDKINTLLEFGLLIKDKASPHPISVLKVVSNNAMAESNIKFVKEKIKLFLKHSKGTPETVKIRTTIDHNVASGIARVSRETMTDIILLGWPHKPGIFNRLVGEKIDAILNRTFKTTFVCHLRSNHKDLKRIVFLAPPAAPNEKGFTLWVQKLLIIAETLQIPIIGYCSADTGNAIHSVLPKKAKINIEFHEFVNWKNLDSVLTQVNKNDLFVFVSARKDSNSHLRIMDTLPSRLPNKVKTTDYIVVLPQTYDKKGEENLHNVSTESIDRGVKTIQKLGRGLFGKKGSK